MAVCVPLNSSSPPLKVRTAQMTCFAPPPLPSFRVIFLSKVSLLLTFPWLFRQLLKALLSIWITHSIALFFVLLFFILFSLILWNTEVCFWTSANLSEGFSFLPCKPFTLCKHVYKSIGSLVVFIWYLDLRHCCSTAKGLVVRVVVEELKGWREGLVPSGSVVLLKMGY